MSQKILGLILSLILLFTPPQMVCLDLEGPTQDVTTPAETTGVTEVFEDQKDISPSTEEIFNIDNYTLPRSFGFYRGSKDMSEIKTIIFSTARPQQYDEKWSANLTGSSHIQGYLAGDIVYIVGDMIYANPKSNNMFAGQNSYGHSLWSGLRAIQGLELLNTSLVISMKAMFAYTNLTDVSGITNWDVSNVVDFSAMFQGHSNSGDVPIEYFAVSNWDTSSAVYMNHMFYGCGKAIYIPVDNWNVSNVITFSHMFADCYSMNSLNITNWDTRSADNFDAFLNDCHSLIWIDVSNLNTSKCRQFSQMFEACVNLKEIVGINNWDVSNASYYAFSETFHCCYSLISLDLSNWIGAPDNVARMFKNCNNLVYIDISGLDLSNASTSEMYDGCENLKNS